MKLYYAPGACSQAVHIALQEAKLPFDKEQVDLKEHRTKSGRDYYEINPKGSVPALELDGEQVLTEAQVVLQYVADQAAHAQLAPAPGSMERYRLQEMLAFVASEVHKAYAPLFAKDTPEETKKSSKDRLGNRFGLLDKHLAGKQYLLGERFSIADAYLYVMLRWAHSLKLDTQRFANLEAWFARVDARPAVKVTLEAEGIQKK